jgi:hypothetical protein
MNFLHSNSTSRSIIGALLLCLAIGSIAQRSAHGQGEASEFAATNLLPLTINCIASPDAIRPGETSRIVATAASPQNRPLSYSYSASAGAISGTGATVVFSSAGVPTGNVDITCRVSDDQGRTATATAVVVVRTPSKAMHPPDLGVLVNPTTIGAAVGSPPPPKPVQQPTPVMSAHPSQTQPAPVQNTQSSPAQSGEYDQGYALETWKNGLKEGKIEYVVPPSMKAQVPAPVTVKIHGFKDAGGQPLLGATGSSTLKVSSYMKVELLAPLNPGEFIITPQGNESIQFVPIDGSATWNWVVTPDHEAKNQKLEIRVSLVYKRPDTTLQDTLDDQNYTVNVEVQKISTTLWQSFQKDPIGFIKYMAPGGAGWGALAALIASLGGFTWWKKKGKKKAVRHPSAK